MIRDQWKWQLQHDKIIDLWSSSSMFFAAAAQWKMNEKKNKIKSKLHKQTFKEKKKQLDFIINDFFFLKEFGKVEKKQSNYWIFFLVSYHRIFLSLMMMIMEQELDFFKIQNFTINHHNVCVCVCAFFHTHVRQTNQKKKRRNLYGTACIYIEWISFCLFTVFFITEESS